MAFQVDNQGNISMIQGDSGTLIIEGLNPEKNYKVYFAVQDESRNAIGDELCVNSNYSSSVIFFLTGDYTDLFKVNKDETCANYYYGIKICDEEENIENTLILENCNINDLNMITVYPKKVEGTKL